MQLKSLEFLFKSESRCRNYLVQRCWGKKKRFCIRCKSPKVYLLGEKRYRCPRCRYTFQDFSGRWLGQLNLSAKQWLWILKLFELESTARAIAGQVEISYPTALKATHLIRCSIIHQAGDDPEIFAQRQWSELCFGKLQTGPGAKHDETAPVFGIAEENGRASVVIVEDVTLDMLADEAVKARKSGSFIYTDRWRSFDSLVFCSVRDGSVVGRKRFGRAPFDSDSPRGFWFYARERLTKFQGTSQHYLPLYLKEMEFRYNHRDQALYELLADAITRLMPKSL